MNVALIGYGYWGKILRRYIESNKQLKLKKIYDINFNNEDLFTNNIEEIISNPDIAILFIATPIETHLDYVIQGLKNKKHIFCEKPLCKKYEDTLKIRELIKENSRVVYTNYIYTESISIDVMRENLEKIGAIRKINASIKQWGNFYDTDDVYEVIGVHMLSAILYILNIEEKERISIKYNALLENKKGLPLSGEIYLTIDDKIECRIEASLLDNKKERTIEIVGEKGKLNFDMLDSDTVTLIEYNTSDTVEEYSKISWNFDESNNLNKSIQSFINDIESNDFISNFSRASLIQYILGERNKLYV